MQVNKGREAHLKGGVGVVRSKLRSAGRFLHVAHAVNEGDADAQAVLLVVGGRGEGKAGG